MHQKAKLCAINFFLGLTLLALSGAPAYAENAAHILYVDGAHETLTAAVSQANRWGNTIILVTANQNLSGGLFLTGSRVQMICPTGAVLSAGGEGFWMLTISGKYDVIRGCTLSPGGFSMSTAILVKCAVRPEISGVTIDGFRSGNGLIYLMQTAAPVIRNNHLVTGPDGPDGIFGEMNTINAVVEGNFLDERTGNAAAHAIAFHSTRPGNTVSGVRITGNTITAGRNFCVEIGPFGGLTPSRVTVNENHCTLGLSGGSGGYSLEVSKSTEVHNTFDAHGFTAIIAAYEIVSSTDLMAEENTAQIGSAWYSVTTSAVKINKSSHTLFSRNFINGWGGGNALKDGGFGVAVVSASVANALVEDNTISNNVLIFPARESVGAIFQQCDAKGTICSNNTYSGNVLIGDGTKGTLGFRLENDSGTTTETRIVSNTIQKVEYGIYLWDTGVTGTRICQNINNARAEVIDNGTRTLRTDSKCL